MFSLKYILRSGVCFAFLEINRKNLWQTQNYSIKTSLKLGWWWNCRNWIDSNYISFFFTISSTVFVSAVLNLAELAGMSDVVRNSQKILYFHENQLVYPVRKQQDRDFQYGYNQIVSWLGSYVFIYVFFSYYSWYCVPFHYVMLLMKCYCFCTLIGDKKNHILNFSHL